MIGNVAGSCPMGCGRTLFLGNGGHVTCSWHACPRPSAADELLDLDTEHAVVFDDCGWTLEHPARERLEGTMHTCAAHCYLRSLSGAPVAEGRYRLTPRPSGYGWAFDRLGSGDVRTGSPTSHGAT